MCHPCRSPGHRRCPPTSMPRRQWPAELRPSWRVAPVCRMRGIARGDRGLAGNHVQLALCTPRDQSPLNPGRHSPCWPKRESCCRTTAVGCRRLAGLARAAVRDDDDFVLRLKNMFWNHDFSLPRSEPEVYFRRPRSRSLAVWGRIGAGMCLPTPTKCVREEERDAGKAVKTKRRRVACSEN